ncbi:SAM-dependent methyltransferase [Hyphomicrobium sp. LHD-15]|uniref:class I SAM-dependent methyltransferase n=1 Tax=Hyphomicrobium sp. LHD-15 TaxID=3072142 RepID=UPI00280E3360|nr:SAM-dependent methyltransferase [Hyphomicrobium sp. LHD-15]MDQ8698338.1 SAM-dependent methyltransferase [Hyphomicrobium sp. LHD-15]
MTTESGGRPADTPLAAKLKDRIRRDGPISVADYMSACLDDPEHGYYRRQTAIGAAGDFVTAPEISQTFGELIGLWCAVVWQQMGSPAALNLVELGPGRGTLMHDALRASRIVPGFREALTIHLVDSNATLRDLQRTTLADCGVPVQFRDHVPDALPPHPTIVIANEFLDTLPIEQFEFSGSAWHRRLVGLVDGDQLRFETDSTPSAAPPSLPLALAARSGDILETCGGHRALADTLLKLRAEPAPLAALFIDYGHAATGFGDTLQGVADQKHVSPFHRPGETDLSAQVDFQSFTEACRASGLATDGPLPQGEFLGRLGIIERASRLMAANPAKAGAIEAGVARLLAPNGMGSRFLALGVRSADVAPLPGFA